MIKDRGIFFLVTKAVDAKGEDPYGWEHEIKMYNVEQASVTTITNSWYTIVH